MSAVPACDEETVNKKFILVEFKIKKCIWMQKRLQSNVIGARDAVMKVSFLHFNVLLVYQLEPMICVAAVIHSKYKRNIQAQLGLGDMTIYIGWTK